MAEIVGWRIVKEKHAASAFSGEGARIFEGRWNSAGVRMVYCSEHLSLAALEILVHTQPVTMRDKFRVFRASWDDAMMATIELKKLPKGWNAQPPRRNFKGDWRRMDPVRSLCCFGSPKRDCGAGKNVSSQSETSRFRQNQNQGPG